MKEKRRSDGVSCSVMAQNPVPWIMRWRAEKSRAERGLVSSRGFGVAGLRVTNSVLHKGTDTEHDHDQHTQNTQ